MYKPSSIWALREYNWLSVRPRSRKQSWQPDLEEQPCCVYEMVTRTRLEELGEDVEEMRGRVNTLFWSVLAAILIDIVLRLTA